MGIQTTFGGNTPLMGRVYSWSTLITPILGSKSMVNSLKPRRWIEIDPNLRSLSSSVGVFPNMVHPNSRWPVFF